jgi:hypothetical protein
MIIATIIALFSLGCPSPVSGTLMSDTFLAVAAPIATHIIFAVNRMQTGRAYSHIGKKRFKAAPSRANVYASSAILWKDRTMRIVATLVDCLPRFIFRTTGLTMSGLSCRDGYCDSFFVQASARLSITAYNVTLSDCFLPTAGTEAFPPSTFIGWGGFTDYVQSAKDLICQIGSDTLRFSHAAFSLVESGIGQSRLNCYRSSAACSL